MIILYNEKVSNDIALQIRLQKHLQLLKLWDLSRIDQANAPISGKQVNKP